MQAFTLKPELAETFAGASFALENGQTFNVAKALEDGGGTIVSEDPEVTRRLSEMDYLEAAAAAPKNAEPPPRAKYDSLPAGEVEALAAGRGVDLSDKPNKTETIKRLRALDEAEAQK